VSKKPKESQAEKYNFSLAFFNSDPQLKKLLHRATAGNWTPDKFTAEYRKTPWFQHHSSTYRTNLATKTSDPQSYTRSLNQTIASLQDEAKKAGAVLSTSQLEKLADHALLYGYSDAQIQNSLGSYVKMSNGQYTGEAGTNAQQLQQSAWRNGVKLSDSSLQSWVRKIETGNATTDDYATYVRNQAKTLAPGLSDQLKTGQDLYDLASPYLSSMSSTLELNQGDLDLFDPTIRKALNSTGADGKPATMSLGDFEQSLRNDPRWMRTKNAQDSFSQTAHSILSSFGFTS
jgi:hypothetical protein